MVRSRNGGKRASGTKRRKGYGVMECRRRRKEGMPAAALVAAVVVAWRRSSCCAHFSLQASVTRFNCTNNQ